MHSPFDDTSSPAANVANQEGKQFGRLRNARESMQERWKWFKVGQEFHWRGMRTSAEYRSQWAQRTAVKAVKNAAFVGVVAGGMHATNEVALQRGMTKVGGIPIVRGYDHNGAFDLAKHTTTGLADAEVWMHGSASPWLLGTTPVTAVRASQAIDKVAKQKDVQSVLIRSCNPSNFVEIPPAGVTSIQGMGTGWSQQGAADVWDDAVVIARGRHARVYHADILRAHADGDFGKWERKTYTYEGGLLGGGTHKGRYYGASLARGETGGIYLGSSVDRRVSSLYPIDKIPYIPAEIKPGGGLQYHLTTGEITDDLQHAANHYAIPLRQVDVDPDLRLSRGLIGPHKVAKGPGHYRGASPVESLDILSPREAAQQLGRTATYQTYYHSKVDVKTASQPANLKSGIQQIHTNLESKTGKFLKKVMKLPFKKHSRLDPMKAAHFLRDLFSDAPSNKEAVGAVRMPSMVANGNTSYGLIAGLQAEANEGVRVLRGYDPGGKAQAGRMPSHLAQLEIWAHGGADEKNKGVWSLLAANRSQTPVQKVVEEVVKQEKVNNVLVSCCNLENAIMTAPKGANVIQGLGLGYHRSVRDPLRRQAGFGGTYGWQNAVVIHDAAGSRIYSKTALQAQLHKMGRLPMDTIQAHESSTINIFREMGGGTRLGVIPGDYTREEIMKASLPIGEVPHVTMEKPKFGLGKTKFVTPGGEKFDTWEEASRTLTRQMGTVPKIGQLKHSELHSGPVSAEEITKAVVGKEAASPVSMKGGNQLSKVSTLASEVSTQVSTAEAMVEGHALKNAKSGFKIKNLGIAAGVAALGAAVIWAGVGAAKMASNSLDGGSRHQSGTFHQHEAGFDKDQMEQFISSTSVRTRNAPTPSLSTNVQVEDADLDMDHVDRMFTNHFKTGYAYSTTPIE